jgi:hypothetical protein
VNAPSAEAAEYSYHFLLLQGGLKTCTHYAPPIPALILVLVVQPLFPHFLCKISCHIALKIGNEIAWLIKVKGKVSH